MHREAQIRAHVQFFGDALKHVTLLAEIQNGEPTFCLLGPGGRIKPFDVFMRALRKRPFNTVDTYARGGARFADYFIEASAILIADNGGAPLTFDQLVDVLEAYDDYLVFGEHSNSDIASRTSRANPSPMVSPRTSELMHAPLRKLLNLSESVRKQMAQIVEAGLVETAVDDHVLYEKELVRVRGNQLTAFRANSMLASVIAGGPKLLEEAILPTAMKNFEQEVSDEQAFPFDLIEVFLDQMTSYRDKALYAFCAASGCRASEALQLLWSDIDPIRQRVRLVNPKKRARIRSYMALTPLQRKKKLVWKGRNTPATLLIEPFATIFFRALELYRREEWKWNDTHDFVFQHVSSRYLGRPFLLSSRSTRHEAFAKALSAARKACVDARLRLRLSAHALRHSYGFYLLNYFPRKDGTYGLPKGIVRQMMGHQSIKSTEVYARHDRDLAEEDIAAYSNTKLFGGGAARRTAEVKKEILLSRLEAVEKELANEVEQCLIEETLC